MSRKERKGNTTLKPHYKEAHTLFPVVLLVFCILLVMQTGGAAGYITGWWGLDQARHLHPWGLVVLLPVAMIAFIPFCRNRVGDFIMRKQPVIKWPRRWIQGLVYAIIGIVVFWNFRFATHFLGDGYIRIRELDIFRPLLLEEPLDLYLHHVFMELVKPYGFSNQHVYVFVSMLAGGIFLFLLPYVIPKIHDHIGAQRFLLLSLIATGIMPLFFGYVENYSIAAVLVFLYVSLLLMDFRNKPAWLALVVSITGCVHLSGFFLLPSYVVHLLYYFKGRALRTRLKVTVKVLVILIVPVLMTLAIVYFEDIPFKKFLNRGDDTGTWVPLVHSGSPQSPPFSLLSLGNAFETLNELLLICPILLFLPAAVFVRRREIWSGRPGMKEVLSLILTYIVLHFAFDLKKGGSRDWDIFAAASVPATLWGALFLIRNFRAEMRKIAPVVVCYGIFQTGTFVAIHADHDRSMDRFSTLVEEGNWSPTARGDAFDELRTYYEKTRNDNPTALTYAYKARDALENARYQYNLAAVLANMKRSDEAMKEFNRLYERYPNHTQGIRDYGYLLMNNERYDEALPIFQKAVRRFPTDALLLNDLGVIYNKLGDLTEAYKYVKLAYQIDDTTTVIKNNFEILRDVMGE